MADASAIVHTIIPMVAIGLSLLTYILNLRALRLKATQDSMAAVQQDIVRLKEELAACRLEVVQCHQDRDAMQRENIALMREMTRRPSP